MFNLSSALSAGPDHSDKKRLHVKLNKLEADITRIMIRKHWGGETVVKNTLGSLWSSFGNFTDDFYDEEFGYCFLSFPTHKEAAKVLNDLNNKQKVLAAVKTLVEVQANGQPQKVTSQILGHLVTNVNIAFFGGKRASWARPKRQDYGRGYDVCNAMEHYDDCPDGEDRFVWDEYCAGRD